jgi:hydrogenase maturation protease
MNAMKKILVYGYGNPGRQDDGLGVHCAKKIKTWAEKQFSGSIDVDMNYQLNIEDAEKISHYDQVIFVDASCENIPAFLLSKLEPSEDQLEFTMHAMSPSYVLHLCQTLFGKHPESHLLHIKGYEWAMKEGLTSKAQQNLEEGYKATKDLLTHYLSKN